jgi:4-amino-4-deoxy-L-arabinose transferase-like glycosyltransferase
MADSKAAETPEETAAAAAPAPTPEPAPLPPRWFRLPARHPYALLALLGLLLWLPGVLSLPALDRDESRFAQSSRQMVESGNWVDIRFGQVPRYKKPVGIYWLQAGASELTSLITGHDDRIWSYRLPSLLGGIAASWLTVWCALAVTEVEGAFLAGLLMLGSVLLTAEATIATTDAVLLACALGMQGVLLRLYRAARDETAPQPSGQLVLWGWAACAFGILVKFPVMPGVGIATMIGLVAWERKWDWLRNIRLTRGLVLTFLLVSPWLIAIAIQSQGAFFQQSLGNDFASKIAGGQESHGAWPAITCFCRPPVSGPPSCSRLRAWPSVSRAAPNPASGSCWCGRQAGGSSWKRCLPSCRIMRSRLIRRSPFWRRCLCWIRVR